MVDVCRNHNSILTTLLDELDNLLTCKFYELNYSNLDLIDKELFEEIKEYSYNDKVRLYFGNTVRDIKCVIQDDTGRKHELLLHIKGPKKLRVVSAKMPCTYILDRDYASFSEIIYDFTKDLNELSCYFYQLEKIDKLCAVMEPMNPTLGDDYRRIYLDDRTWLHVGVTVHGLATNIHIIGQTEEWNNKLLTGLLLWDHDKDIVDNILHMFDLPCFSFPERNSPAKETYEESGPTCSICLCTELSEACGLPQPLCKNYTCGVFFHRSCLYQWLIACSGNHQPAFGVATGLCPSCFQHIDCLEKDN